MGEKLLLFGPPGVGKGTQAIRLAATLRVPHISTGEMLRTAMQSRTPLGERVRSFVEHGRLVADDTMVDVVRERLAQRDALDGFVLDGFPRTVSQADSLWQILEDARSRVDAVVVLDAPADALVERLSGRRICESCQSSFHLRSGPPRVAGTCDRCGGVLIQRTDDSEATVRFRQSDYLIQTRPVLEVFARKGWPVLTVAALGDVEQVFGRAYAAIFWRN